MVYSEDVDLKEKAATLLVEEFGLLEDREAAWKDLIRLTSDSNYIVRQTAVCCLGAAFRYVPDKENAWKDLIRMTNDKDRIVQWQAANALESAFQYVPDKEAAWKDLHRLTCDQDCKLRHWAAYILEAAFPYIPNKEAAWKDLHKLTNDHDCGVRWGAAYALGAAFQYILDKEAVWEDLHRLSHDSNPNVRCNAYHSMGRISILKATKSDDKLRTYLEEATEFFRRSSEEAKVFNPAAFCLPFYLSLHYLLFTDVPKEDEVQRYIAEAKRAIEGSENEDVLLEAVNNLSKALQEVKAYSVEDIILRRRDLKSYTKYCLQASECLREARSKAPLASKVVDYLLIEKSIPILDQKIT